MTKHDYQAALDAISDYEDDITAYCDRHDEAEAVHWNFKAIRHALKLAAIVTGEQADDQGSRIEIALCDGEG